MYNSISSLGSMPVGTVYCLVQEVGSLKKLKCNDF